MEEVRLDYVQDSKRDIKNVKYKISLIDELINVHKDALKTKNEWLAERRIHDLKEAVEAMTSKLNEGKELSWDLIKENEDVFQSNIAEFQLTAGEKLMNFY